MGAVHLVRHGQASFGAEDYDVLSPLGERQAAAVGDELRRRAVAPVSVWSGNLRRQQVTAKLALPDADVQVDPRWNEYDHLALVSHLAADAPVTSPREFQAALDRVLHAWIVDGVDAGAAGTFVTFADTAVAALDELVSGLGKGETAVVFTSGGVIASVCARLLELPPRGFLAVNRVVANASITTLVTGRSGTSLVSFNEHGHFDGPARDLLTYR
jgi:broad specificity phosphatase PhoE